MAIENIKILGAVLELQSNLAIMNFWVTLKLFVNAKSSLMQISDQNNVYGIPNDESRKNGNSFTVR